jgi:hypothetical protein
LTPDASSIVNASKLQHLRGHIHMLAAPGSSRVATGLRIVAALLFAQLLWIAALAASPALHAWAHHDLRHTTEHEENQENHHHAPPEHHCAVTTFLSGGCDWAASGSIAIAANLLSPSELVWGDLPLVVFSLRGRGVLEHAPPQRV